LLKLRGLLLVLALLIEGLKVGAHILGLAAEAAP